MIRFGNTAIPAELLRAQLMQQQQQQQIRRTGLHPLINAINGPGNIRNQMAFAPRLAFMNRPGMRPGMPGSVDQSAAFFNSLLRAPGSPRGKFNFMFLKPCFLVEPPNNDLCCWFSLSSSLLLFLLSALLLLNF